VWLPSINRGKEESTSAFVTKFEPGLLINGAKKRRTNQLPQSAARIINRNLIGVYFVSQMDACLLVRDEKVISDRYDFSIVCMWVGRQILGNIIIGHMNDSFFRQRLVSKQKFPLRNLLVHFCASRAPYIRPWARLRSKKGIGADDMYGIMSLLLGNKRLCDKNERPTC
jgi:hypothetical protein